MLLTLAGHADQRSFFGHIMKDTALANKRYLIVDDDDFSCDVLQSVLTHLGCSDIHYATTGHTALSLARQHQPDFVLLDIYMPEADGWTMLSQLRAVLPNASILMVTGTGMQADFLKSIDAHADGFCIKPVATEILQKALLNALNRRQHRVPTSH